MSSGVDSFVAILFMIVVTLFGITVPGLIIGLLLGYLLSWSFRFTRRVSNDAFVGALGYATGFLLSMKWGNLIEVVAPAGAVLLVLLRELYIFMKLRQKNATT
jgi:NhaP-type Na+/H+ or K+/H+ antiporter